MISIRDEAAFLCALRLPIDDRLQDMLYKRRTQLGYDFDLTELAHFLIVEPNDELPTIEQTLGFSPLMNQVDGSRLGQPDFSPSTEWITDHGYCFEAVFVLEDSGFGHVVILPRVEGIEPSLIALCEQFASLSPEGVTRD